MFRSARSSFPEMLVQSERPEPYADFVQRECLLDPSCTRRRTHALHLVGRRRAAKAVLRNDLTLALGDDDRHPTLTPAREEAGEATVARRRSRSWPYRGLQIQNATDLTYIRYCELRSVSADFGGGTLGRCQPR
jgi:hypothetical protein